MNSWNPLEETPRLETYKVRGVDVHNGSRVRLWPRGRADIFDLALEGMAATVESIEQDYEGRLYFTVTVDEDPGKDFGKQRKPGHRFFFGPEEIEPLAEGTSEGT